MPGDTADAPSFPPLLTGVEVDAVADPFREAVDAAADSDPGALYWSPAVDRLRAAILFAPDRPLGDAMTAMFVIACGMHDCLGALAPPETAVHHLWPNRLLVNGAECGVIRAAAPSRLLREPSNWLVIGITLELAPVSGDPGRDPNRTTLAEEGCGALGQRLLLESWSRHTMAWIHRWMEDGPRPILDHWLARAAGRDAEQAFVSGSLTVRGQLLGLDEWGNALVRSEGETREIPLAGLLDAPFPSVGPARG